VVQTKITKKTPTRTSTRERIVGAAFQALASIIVVSLVAVASYVVGLIQMPKTLEEIQRSVNETQNDISVIRLEMQGIARNDIKQDSEIKRLESRIDELKTDFRLLIKK
jgi:uncharacterized protein YoxC